MTRLLLLLETSDFFQFIFIALKHGYNRFKKENMFPLVFNVNFRYRDHAQTVTP